MSEDNGARHDSTSTFQSLIDSVRQEAVENAEAEANRVLTRAEKQAVQILTQAKKEAERVVDEARRQAESFEISARDALKRAARDTLLGVEAALLAKCEAVLERDADMALNEGDLPDILLKLVENWRLDQPEAELEALLEPSDVEALERAAKNGLRGQLPQGLTLKPAPELNAGLRIGLKDGSVHYDFSAATLAEWLGRFVSPRLRDAMREAAGEAPPPGK